MARNWLTPRRIVGGLALAVLAWVMFTQAVASVLGGRIPAQVRAMTDFSTAADAGVATKLIQRKRESDRVRARDILRDAQQRDPYNAALLRLTGSTFGSEKPSPKNLPYFQLSERVSRRDLGTQVYFILRAGEANDVPEALRRYDRALRTHYSARDTLFPGLLRGIGLAEGQDALAKFAQNDPPWLPDFVSYAADRGSNPRALASLAIALGGFPDTERMRIAEQATVEALDAKGEHDILPAFLNVVHGFPRGLADGAEITTASLEPKWQPFTWWMSAQPGVSASPDEDDKGNPRIRIEVEGGLGGAAARKLMLLKPGRYTLNAVQKPDATASTLQTMTRANWVLRCASKKDRRMIWETAGEPRTIAASFVVPDKCPVQQLTIQVQTVGEGGLGAVVVGPVTIRPGAAQ